MALVRVDSDIILLFPTVDNIDLHPHHLRSATVHARSGIPGRSRFSKTWMPRNPLDFGCAAYIQPAANRLRGATCVSVRPLSNQNRYLHRRCRQWLLNVVEHSTGRSAFAGVPVGGLLL